MPHVSFPVSQVKPAVQKNSACLKFQVTRFSEPLCGSQGGKIGGAGNVLSLYNPLIDAGYGMTNAWMAFEISEPEFPLLRRQLLRIPQLSQCGIRDPQSFRNAYCRNRNRPGERTPPNFIYSNDVARHNTIYCSIFSCLTQISFGGVQYYIKGMGAPISSSMVQDKEKIYNSAKLAKFFGVSEKTIWEWCKKRKLPAFKIGKEWRVRMADLRKMIDRKVRTLRENKTSKLF